MRITFGMLADRIRSNLVLNSQRMMDAQDRASSGKRLRRPSDDVPGAGRSLNLRSALASIEQFERNSGIAHNLLSVTNDALTNVVTRLQSVRTLAAGAASSAVTSEARLGLAAQLDQIITEMQSISNTQYLGRYIFSGSLTSTETIAGPPFTFQGNNKASDIQIAPGTYVVANVTGDKVFNMGGVANPAAPDVFATLVTLRNNILAGNITATSAQIDEIDAQLGNVVAIQSQIGGRVGRVETTDETLLDSRLKLMDLLSTTEDADLAEAVLELRTTENIYQAAMSTAARMIDFSLSNMWK